MARPTAALAATADELTALRRLADSADMASTLARQARILLLLAEGQAGTEVARLTGASVQTVCAWRMRFRRERLAALKIEPLPLAADHAARTPDAPLQPVTLQHIADLVQVHKSTVHRILHRRSGTTSPLARKIDAAARDLGYKPEANHAARQLSLRRFRRQDTRRQILFYLPTGTFRAPFFQRQFHGAMDVLAGTGFDVLVRLSDELSDRQLPLAIERGEVAAVISQDHPDWMAIELGLLARLHPSLRPPLICLLQTIPDAWSITIDHHQAGRMAISHLLDLGHRHFIAVEQRLACTEGFQAELSARGLDPQQHLAAMHIPHGSEPHDQRYAGSLKRLLELQPMATAYLAPNDPAAARAIQLFSEWGRTVPDAMSVIGFDDTDPVIGPDQRNRLSSIALPLDELGRAAARCALDPNGSPRLQIFPVELMIRTTTGPAPRHR